MSETVRIESIERKERVKNFAVEHMEQNSSFPSSRAIQNKFLQYQYPGNLNDIAKDLKEVAKDISIVYQSKQTVDIDGVNIDIPTEALEYTIRAYQMIELQQNKKFEVYKEEVERESEEISLKYNDLKSEYSILENKLDSNLELLTDRDDQLDEIKNKLSIKEDEFNQQKDAHHQQELKFESEKSELNNKIGQLKTSHMILENERAEQKAQIQELKKVIQELQAKVTNFEEHLHTLALEKT